MLPPAAPFALFDDNLDGGGDLLLEGLRETVACSAPGDLPAAFQAIAAAGRSGCWVAVAASYELGYALEPHLQPLLPPDSGPLLSAWIFERGRWQDAETTTKAFQEAVAGMEEHRRLAGAAALSYGLREAEHGGAVARIRALIAAGDCYQVNLAFPLEGEIYGDPLALYQALREAQPVRHGAFVRHPAGTILSRAPELFVARHESRLTSRPALQEVFRALFPCGSITGAPKIRAMEIIRELEPAPRGLYGGALGWVAPDGAFRFGVSIRTLVVDQSRRMWFGLGSGIVADSDPAEEWAECLLQGAFLTRRPAPFGLIETLRCEPEAARPYPLLERHLERLTASAAHFGFPCDPGAVRAALMDRAKALQGCHRVRLVLESSGRIELTVAPMDPGPPATPPTVVLSPRRVAADDPLARHKTTARAFYDGELARVTALGHFDALFLNDRGELAEGARTSVFLDMGDGVLLTPALECGVLDGVYRRTLIAEGRARPARLGPDELRRAAAIHVANAARGLVRVTLVEDNGGPTASPGSS